MQYELKYPLLNRKWRWIAYALFPFPIIVPIASILVPYEFPLPQEAVADFFQLCWAIGFGILIFSRQKQEDEMIEHFRLKSFALGVYYLIWGLGVLAIAQIIHQGSLFTDYMSAYLAVFLLNTYIFISFQYFIWKNRH